MTDSFPSPAASGDEKPIWKRWWFWIVAVVIVASVGNLGDDPEEEPVTAASATTSTTVDTTSTSTTTTKPEATTSTSASQVVPLPAYEIIETEDVSFAGAVRISLRVTVEEGATAEEIRALAEQLAAQFRESHEYQAFNIFFYHYPELAFDFATVGIWDDSPFGDWGRAAEVERGDYAQHTPNDRIKEKDWSLLPSQEEVDLYVAYNTKFDEMDTGSELPSDDEVIAAVSADTGVSTDQIEDALNAVLAWMLNEG